MLAFAAVHGELHRVPVGSMESFIAVQNTLNVVFARRQIPKMTDWVAESVVIRNNDRLAGRQPIHVDAEKDLRLDGKIDLHARFLRWISREQNEDAPIKRLRAAVIGERNGELGPIGWRWNSGQGRNRDGAGDETEREFE